MDARYNFCHTWRSLCHLWTPIWILFPTGESCNLFSHFDNNSIYSCYSFRIYSYKWPSLYRTFGVHRILRIQWRRHVLGGYYKGKLYRYLSNHSSGSDSVYLTNFRFWTGAHNDPVWRCPERGNPITNRVFTIHCRKQYIGDTWQH